jgi:hypothetical protein
MKNDITWEHSESSELDKQTQASSLGNLAGLRSKTPSPIPHSPSPILSTPHSPLPTPYSQSSSNIHNPSSISTWKRTDNSEQNKQQATRLLHKLVDLRRKTFAHFIGNLVSKPERPFFPFPFSLFPSAHPPSPILK